MPQTLDEQRSEARERLVLDGYHPDQANRMALMWYPVPRQSANGHAPTSRRAAAKNSAGRQGNPGNRGNRTPRTAAQLNATGTATKARWARVHELGLHTLAELRDYEKVTS